MVGGTNQDIMVYLFSSAPTTICRYLELRQVKYTLVPKEELKSFTETYIPLNEDWGLVYDFGKFISKTLLDKLFMVNIHFSLLPNYRGATPVEAALLHGDTETGITIQRMVSEMDAGAIISTMNITIQKSWSAGELQAYMDSKLPEMLELLVDNHPRELPATEQVGTPTFCYERLLDREGAQLVFVTATNIDLLSRIRAYNPEPLAWFTAQKQGKIVQVNVFRAEVIEGLVLAPGEVTFIKKRGMAIGCQSGCLLITELIVSGSKRLVGGDIVALKGQIEVLL